MNFLISKKEYYRAHVELKRLKFFYPAFIPFQRYYVTERYLLFKGAQYCKLMDDLPVNGSIQNGIHEIFKIDSYHMQQKFLPAYKILSSWTYCNNSVNDGLSFHKYFYKRRMFNLLMTSKFDELEITKKNYNCIDSSKYKELVNYAQKKHNDMKYPLGGAFLGIIPGMGYIYSGEMGTGITAFIVIALSAAGSYFSFKTNNRAIGIFVGAIGTFFYTGNIVGGYMAAKRYNRGKMEQLNDYLIDKLLFESDREYIYNKFGKVNDGKRK
ncbi:hypothetical protein ACFL20_10350 [Spirochaetota bacterium]